MRSLRTGHEQSAFDPTRRANGKEKPAPQPGSSTARGGDPGCRTARCRRSGVHRPNRTAIGVRSPLRTGHPVTIGGSRPRVRNEGTRSGRSVAGRLSALAPAGGDHPNVRPQPACITVEKHPISRPQPSYRKAVPTVLTQGAPEPEMLVYTTQVIAVMPIITPEHPRRGCLAI